MKKRKMKKKAWYVFITILILLSAVVYFLYDSGLFNNISKYYNNKVVVTKDTDIYDKDNKKIGTIKKGVKLKLKDSKNSKYFEVADGSFYIYYKDVSKDKSKDFENNYLVFNKNIVKKNVSLLVDGKEKIKINKEISFKIEYMDDKYYYVSYLGSLFQIKKGSNDKIIDSKNTNQEEVQRVSVLNYVVNDDNKAFIDEEFKVLKDNNYKALSIKEYNLWLKGYIRLIGNNILLTGNIKYKSNGYEILEASGIDFVDNNRSSNREELNRYTVNSSTNMDTFMKMLALEDIIDKKATKIAVLNYHFFYDPTKGEECYETICLPVSKFREHLDYFKENNFRTLTMKEFKQWMYGEIDLPEKSVLITVDDGAKGTGKHNGNKLIPLLEEYKMHATLFLIAGWWDISNYQSKYLDVQSHTYDMHNYGTCGKGQLVCANYDQAKSDLEKSLTIIGDKTSFCYPFYSYSDTAIKAVKDVGFEIAFAGGNRKATRESNKYLIPRYPILDSITLNDLKRMVN